MLRIHRRMSVAAAILCGGLAFGDSTIPPWKPANNAKYITLKSESGRERRCQILRTYKHPAGGVAYEVKDLQTGEVMTVIDNISPYHTTASKAAQTVVASKPANADISPYHATDWTVMSKVPSAPTAPSMPFVAAAPSPMPAATRPAPVTVQPATLATQPPAVVSLPSAAAPKAIETASVTPPKVDTPAKLAAEPTATVKKVASEMPADPIMAPTLFVSNEKVQREIANEPAKPEPVKSTKFESKYTAAPVPATQRWFSKPADKAPVVKVVAAQPQPVQAVRHSDPVIRLVGCLKDDMLPSMREVAADSLAHGEGRRRPEVIAAMIDAARSDPAVSVRLACVRYLGEMKAESKECETALRGLCDDSDGLVRAAAAEAVGEAKSEK